MTKSGEFNFRILKIVVFNATLMLLILLRSVLKILV